MIYSLRLDILKLIEIVKGMTTSHAACVCGRHYRLIFDQPVKGLLEKIEAAVKDEPDLTRNQLLEVD